MKASLFLWRRTFFSCFYMVFNGVKTFGTDNMLHPTSICYSSCFIHSKTNKPIRKQLVALVHGCLLYTSYPDLYVKDVQEKKDADQKVVYLTFDDGPSKYTTQTLDLLDRYNVKATFFVVNYDSVSYTHLKHIFAFVFLTIIYGYIC